MKEITISILITTLKQISFYILPIVVLSLLMYQAVMVLSKMCSRVLGRKAYMLLLGWPGTLVHEISHALTGLLFLHKIDSFHLNLFSSNTGKAGSVSMRHDPNSWYQRMGTFFVAIAPVFGCAGVLCVISYFLLPGFFQYPTDINMLIDAILVRPAYVSTHIKGFVLQLSYYDRLRICIFL